jgi:CBS domain-containing protein
MGKQVSDVMTPGVQTVRLSDSAATAARLMRDNDVGSLPVVGEDGAPVGVITDRDLAVRLVADRRDPNETRVEELYSRELVTVAPEESLDEALQRMAEHKVRRLPVVDDGRLVGMLAQADIALEESAKKAGELLEQVSEPTSAARV